MRPREARRAPKGGSFGPELFYPQAQAGLPGSKLRAATPSPGSPHPLATPPPDAAEKPERSSGGAPPAAHWACSAGRGRAGLRAASRKPSPSGGCGRERASDGPRNWAHVPRGHMPRVSQPDAQLASASAASSYRLPALSGCGGEELQRLPCSGCAHCPQGPLARATAGPGTLAPGTRPRHRSTRRGALLADR